MEALPHLSAEPRTTVQWAWAPASWRTAYLLNGWEHLIHDVIQPAARACEPEVLACTRLLAPVAANEDGTWTYVIMPDPLDGRFDYDATRYVREALGEEQAAEADRLWDECHAKPQYEIALKQAEW